MQKIYIDSKDAFRASVRDDIKEDDIFYDQYKRAFQILLDILSSFRENTLVNIDYPKFSTECSNTRRINKNRNYKNIEYSNNIIAFCGERGEGKTSTMLTFAYSIYNQSKTNNCGVIDIDGANDELKNVYFSEPIIIEPSAYDDSHNIMDIVLANLYKNFENVLSNGELTCDKYERSKVQELNSCFEKVYRCISLLANPNQIKEHEYDYEGSVSNLSKLGESTMLREKFIILVEKYLDFMTRGNDTKSSKNIIIAIDDLDLCSQNAYSVAEQIRKYLVIPNVVIVMAVKIEQLKLCVSEKNISNFEKILKVNDNSFSIIKNVGDMSSKYVDKLIPKFHRICLPKLSKNITVIYNNGNYVLNYAESYETEIITQVINEVYKKTEMIFIKDESENCYIVPNNMREFINFYLMIKDELHVISSINDFEILKKNVKVLFEYYFNALYSDVNPSVKNAMNYLIADDNISIHKKAIYYLDKQEYGELDIDTHDEIREVLLSNKNYNFSNVLYALKLIDENVYSEDIKKSANIIRVFYTSYLSVLYSGIKLNKEYPKRIRELLGNSVWKNLISEVMPSISESKMSRTRFNIKMSTLIENMEHYKEIYNTDLITGLKWNVYLSEKNKSYTQSINNRKIDNKTKYILGWILIGLFADVDNERTFVSDNFQLEGKSVSIENYLYGLSNLYALYDKLNLSLIGVDENDYKMVVDDLEKYNADIVKYTRYIFSSIDVMLEIINSKKYKKVKQYNNVKANENEQTSLNRANVENFFENIAKILATKIEHEQPKCENEENIIELSKKLKHFKYGENEFINIPQLYAYMIEVAIQDNRDFSNKEIQENEMYQKYKSELEDILNGRILNGIDYSQKAYEPNLPNKRRRTETIMSDMRKMAMRVMWVANDKKSLLSEDDKYKVKIRDFCIELEKEYKNAAFRLTLDENARKKITIDDSEIFKLYNEIYNAGLERMR